MEWEITREDLSHPEKTGVVRFIERMERELRNDGTPIEGFQFLNSPLEMLTFSREIEEEALEHPDGAVLYVGFQNSHKLLGEQRRYRRMLEAGVQVIGFGEGEAPEFLSQTAAEWVTLPRNHYQLVNQWFLVATSPAPIAFVGWETSEAGRFGVGGVSASDKSFEGFVTEDPRVVSALVEHLDQVRTGTHQLSTHVEDLSAYACELPGFPNLGFEDDAVPRMMGPDHSGLRLDIPVGRILAITDLHGTSEFKALRGWATELAIANGSQLVLFEMSAASYLVTPYPEDCRKQWRRILNWRELLPLGRAPLARQLARIQARGVEAGAILPTTHGFKHLAHWAEESDIDLILLPTSLVRPGLLSRLRGYSLDTLLEHTDRRVMVVADNGTMCMANMDGDLADSGLNHRTVGGLVA